MRRSEAGCASRSFFGGCSEGSTAPGAASAARAGVRFSFAGRSAVLRRGRCEPALLREAPKMQLPCRRLRRPRRVLRHGPAASCSATMALRPRCLSTEWPGMPPWLPPLPRSPRQFGFDQGLCSVPSCPASLPEVSRGCRAAASRMSLTADPVTAWHIRLDSPLPPVMRRHGASVPTGASPHAIRDTWHRGSRGTWTSPAASYGCRARAGFPPAVRASPVWSEWLPTDHHTAVPRRRGIYTWHQGGTRKECLAALPPLAAMPI